MFVSTICRSEVSRVRDDSSQVNWNPSLMGTRVDKQLARTAGPATAWGASSCSPRSRLVPIALGLAALLIPQLIFAQDLRPGLCTRGIAERLDEGEPLLQAMIESDEYIQYTLDRRLGCRRLGMNLASTLRCGKNAEIYEGRQALYRGMRIDRPYFERDYVSGTATDKLPVSRFQNPLYAVRFAELLGRAAAAANMVVGRCCPHGHMLFDDGDEILVEDEHGLPVELVVADYTGAFADYERNFTDLVATYLCPVNTRMEHMPNPAVFSGAYVNALVTKLGEIQQKYREQKRAFDTLFAHRHRDHPGSLAYRWDRILSRLAAANLEELERELRRQSASQMRSTEGAVPSP
ncbi:MAG: hypothetical protein NTY19_08090 [Planctomycetota bacterium]|nr:hypothetical protein [Planctomycetota bacterium]